MQAQAGGHCSITPPSRLVPGRMSPTIDVHELSGDEPATRFEHLIQKELASRVRQVRAAWISFADEAQAFRIDGQVDVLGKPLNQAETLRQTGAALECQPPI